MLKKSNSTNSFTLEYGCVSEPNNKIMIRAISKCLIEISNIQNNKFVVKDLFFLPKEKKLYNFNIYDIQKLLLLLNVHGKLAIDVNIHAFIYMLRFINEDSSYKITKNNWILIVLISYMIASKYCDDISIRNEDFCYLYSNILTLEKLQHLELEFLKIIDYNLSVSPKDYTEIYFELLNNYL